MFLPFLAKFAIASAPASCSWWLLEGIHESTLWNTLPFPPSNNFCIDSSRVKSTESARQSVCSGNFSLYLWRSAASTTINPVLQWGTKSDLLNVCLVGSRSSTLFRKLTNSEIQQPNSVTSICCCFVEHSDSPYLPPSNNRTMRSEAVLSSAISSSLSLSTVFWTISSKHSTKPASTSCSLMTSGKQHG